MKTPYTNNPTSSLSKFANFPGFRAIHLALSDFAVSRLGTKKYILKTIDVINSYPREIHDDDDI